MAKAAKYAGGKTLNRDVQMHVAHTHGREVVINSKTVRVYQVDESGLILRAAITDAITNFDSQDDFAKGALLVLTNAATGLRATYQNIGTSASSSFLLIGDEQPAAVTATADGLTTGIIPPTAQHVTVTSSDANHIVVLPAPVVGKKITIHVGATGFELRSSAPATIAINGGSGADAESAIAANSTCELTCVSSTAWKGFFMDADSDLAKIEAAA